MYLQTRTSRRHRPAFDGAVAEAHLLGADEMEAVVVAVDAVVNIDAVEIDELALDDANAVIGAIEKRKCCARRNSRTDDTSTW